MTVRIVLSSAPFGISVEVASVGLEAESLGLNGDVSSAAEGIEDRRQSAVCRAADLAASLIEDLLVVYVLPEDEAFYDCEETIALPLLSLLCREEVRP